LKEHRKHSRLAAAGHGNFGRFEWSLHGTSCAKIKALAAEVIHLLNVEYACIYVDSAHENEATSDTARTIEGSTLCQYEEQYKLSIEGRLNIYKKRSLFNEFDLILVNGNHNLAVRQLLIMDEAKRESIRNHKEKLSRIDLLVSTRDDLNIPLWIKELFPDIESKPVVSINNIKAIADYLSKTIREDVAPLKGLVLAGGKSERLGYDKTLINWNGKAQKYHLCDMLSEVCDEVYLSCRAGQSESIEPGYPTLEDTFIDLGPYGAILSAFRSAPQSAFLVVASDLPLLDLNLLKQLKKERNPACVATTFKSPYDGLPEPLISIWEPKSYMILLHYLAQGISCPRKVLLNNTTKIIEAPDAEQLWNVNTKDDIEKVNTLRSQKY
jgi:molybdopterin-guanine dinucleotide biosynthesis protein A